MKQTREQQIEQRRIEQQRRIHEIYERRRIKRYNAVIELWKARGWL